MAVIINRISQIIKKMFTLEKEVLSYLYKKRIKRTIFYFTAILVLFGLLLWSPYNVQLLLWFNISLFLVLLIFNFFNKKSFALDRVNNSIKDLEKRNLSRKEAEFLLMIQIESILKENK